MNDQRNSAQSTRRQQRPFKMPLQRTDPRTAMFLLLSLSVPSAAITLAHEKNQSQEIESRYDNSSDWFIFHLKSDGTTWNTSTTTRDTTPASENFPNQQKQRQQLDTMWALYETNCSSIGSLQASGGNICVSQWRHRNRKYRWPT